MRRTLVAIAIIALATVGVALAEPDCAQSACVYVPMSLTGPPTPTPIPPTPIPAPIQTLTIQLSEMKSGYVLNTSKEITNADAAKGYHDPKAAAKAFQQQGRETSWMVIYTSTDYVFSDALGVGNQVFRYLTVEGATQGHAYLIPELLKDDPDFRAFNISMPCCPVVGLRRTFKSGSYTYDEFDISIQAGRYLTDVGVIGLAGSVSVDRAIYYAQLALDHVYTTPQVLRATADQESVAPVPASGSEHDALIPR